jgi:UDP-glucuronate 4-epimerase
MRVLVTGCAGFIGFHTALRLLARGEDVIGIDNLNDYYDPQLKQDRLDLLLGRSNFRFTRLDIADRSAVAEYFHGEHPQRVIHLAAQAGVRYSLSNPHAYVDSNLVGFVNVLEGCRNNRVEHLVYASSSSVYGSNQNLPFSVKDNVDHPVSLYAATKKANELMAHTYSHLFNLPTTGLRFFTVYGPWGRPDMALFQFTRAILEGATIDVYNQGDMKRDFTYIDDVVEGITRVLDHVPAALSRQDQARAEAAPDSGSHYMIASVGSTPSVPTCPCRLYNIGNHTPVDLLYFIQTIEQATGKRAVKNLLPMQPGDVRATYADVDDLMHDVGFAPSTPIEVGVVNFVAWFRQYYHARRSRVNEFERTRLGSCRDRAVNGGGRRRRMPSREEIDV